MAVDSKALFSSRVRELGLMEFSNQLEAHGYDTMANLAFSCNYVPGNADETPFLEVALRIMGDMGHLSLPSFRRLHYEACSMIAADTHRKTAGNEDENKPRKLPREELAARLEATRAALPGLDLTDECEPSHSLLDKLIAMKDSGELRHIRWEELTARNDEIRGEKSLEMFKFEGGNFKKVAGRSEPPADTSTEAKFMLAMQRRGVALEIARLMTYKAHEKLVAKYLKAIRHPPIEGYKGVTMQQVYLADVEAFSQAANLLKCNLSEGDDGTLPMDAILSDLLGDAQIRMLLTQMPGGQSSKRETSTEVDKLREEVKRLKSNPQWTYQGSTKGKGKEKGKGKGSKGKVSKTLPMPRELVDAGAVPTIGDQRLCFNYNMVKGCTNTVNNGACSRGVHRCAKMGCGGFHPIHQCSR
eukprot:4324886-Karenia_brevis.AAC.1